MHSNEEGKIIDFINDKMVMVDVRGVKFPVYLDQIDFPYFKRFSQKKIVETSKKKQFVDEIRKEKAPPKDRVVDGVWLTVLPVMENDEFGDEVTEDLKLHLVNNTNDALNFTYTLNFAGEKDFELKNTIHPFQDFYLHDVAFEDVNDSPSFEFEFSLVTSDKKRAEFFEAAVKPRPKQVFTRIQELREKNQATFSYNLFTVYPPKAVDNRLDLGKLTSAGYKIYDAKEARQHLEPARSVIDLHAEKLTDQWEKMSNFEILTLQLRTFEKYYELAIAHTRPSLIVVHGMGTGKLRDEIHELLRHRREVKSFVNQYDSRFGYGATEIFFQY